MIEINNTTKDRIPLKSLQNLGQGFLDKYKKSSELVSVAFISSAEMKKLNQKYRGLSKTTDVLSFVAEDNQDSYLGEVLIDYNQIKKQAKQFNKTVKTELEFIFVHGLLHLLGYTDDLEKDRVQMIKLADKFLSQYYKKML